MGKGTLAIRIANWFRTSSAYELSRVVPVVPEPTWTDSLASWARQNDVAVVDSGHYRDIDLDDPTTKPDIVFSVFYDKIIKPWFIEKVGCILNLHNGPLPRYRGVSPINWALKNNEQSHGVTIHHITAGIDSGPIVGQLQYSIYPEFDEVADVYSRALEYGWTLFQQTMPIFPQIVPRQQDDAAATYYNSSDNARLGERRDFTRHKSLEMSESRPSSDVPHGGR
jgi:methionyl-tRNA formyltransferase